MPRKAQPVPPIYQPEVGARAVVWAAAHDDRELNVGVSTSIVVFGNKLVPGFGDHYLAETGVDSQMTAEPEDPSRANNLWRPVPGDVGAHGRFDERARRTSWQLRLVTSGLWLEARRARTWVAEKLTGTSQPPRRARSAAPGSAADGGDSGRAR